MNKRYQVFVSSTYEDLKEERNEVIKALLELDCFPCGMEYFPAQSESQWNYIKNLIDESDYYILIVAGKYGSTEPESGLSYTRREYEYALSKGIPTISFFHANLGNLLLDKSETGHENREKLDDFVRLVKTNLCKPWLSAAELGSVVSRSITQEIKRNPRVGWVRADSVPENAEKTMIHLYEKIASLEKKIQEGGFPNEVGGESLPADSEEIIVNIELRYGHYSNGGRWHQDIYTRPEEVKFTWREIYHFILPKMISPIEEKQLRTYLGKMVKERFLMNSNEDLPNLSIQMNNEPFETIKIQLEGLGFVSRFIEDYKTEKGVPKKLKFFVLTEKGKEKLIKLRVTKEK